MRFDLVPLSQRITIVALVAAVILTVLAVTVSPAAGAPW